MTALGAASHSDWSIVSAAERVAGNMYHPTRSVSILLYKLHDLCRQSCACY